MQTTPLRLAEAPPTGSQNIMCTFTPNSNSLFLCLCFYGLLMPALPVFLSICPSMVGLPACLSFCPSVRTWSVCLHACPCLQAPALNLTQARTYLLRQPSPSWLLVCIHYVWLVLTDIFFVGLLPIEVLALSLPLVARGRAWALTLEFWSRVSLRTNPLPGWVPGTFFPVSWKLPQSFICFA